jgi:cell wall-associated NlpC family hydrolase
MRRLIPLLGAVLALSFSSTAAADTFRVAHSPGGGGSAPVAFAPDTSVVPFTQAPSGPMSFAALRSIWQAAGATYGIPWTVLAAINKVETNFGQNLGPSSAGAVGWMQFMPSTWARWGTDANGDGIADPDNPTDAIFSAARYLAACGGQMDIAGAVYCYNHSRRYVNDVLTLAALYGRGAGASVSVGQLQAQVASARSQVKASRAQLGAALARARRLGQAEHRYLHVADTAPLLSDRLEARKQAVRLGVRHRAAEGRVAQLRKLVDTATTQLGQAQGVAGGASFAPNGFGPLSTTGSDGSILFSTGDSSAPYSGVSALAMQYLGVPYVWGGNTPTGFDCSGLVQYVFAQVGVTLPHYTVAQWKYPGAVAVPRDQLQSGDLVFFNGLDHVGIYLGDGYFIDSPHTGATVRIDSLGEPWYAARYDGARRILGSAAAAVPQTLGATAFATGDSSTFSSNVVYFITH